MAPTKAQESIAIRIIPFPHRFQGGIRASQTTTSSLGRAGLQLASMLVAMPEQLEKSHSSSLRLSCIAQPSVFHSERRCSARGSSDPRACWRR